MILATLALLLIKYLRVRMSHMSRAVDTVQVLNIVRLVHVLLHLLTERVTGVVL